MAFYSSIKYFRQAPAPQVTGISLSQFIRRFSHLGVTKPLGEKYVFKPLLRISFGDAIDMDYKPTTIEENSGGMFSRIRDIEWDVEESSTSLDRLAEAAADKGTRTVYRACVNFGTAPEELTRGVSRVGSTENKEDFTPCDWSLQLEPIEIALLASNRPWHVGWISLNLSGYGYLFPWTVMDAVKKMSEHPGTASAAQLCREMWPVEPVAPQWRVRRGRKKLGEAWPHPIDAPMGWYWGVSETG